MTTETKLENQVTVGSELSASEQHVAVGIRQGTKLYQFYTHSWFQVCLIGFICFCLPGVRWTLTLSKMGDRRLTGAPDVQCPFGSRWLWSG